MEKEIYHIFNRGVDKREVFMEDKDRVRFIHDLFVFNDIESSSNFLHTERQKTSEGSVQLKKSRLVKIHAFCLMKNHYHLLISPIEEDGVSLFMKKVNMGYSKYFNEKYKRTGALWQGKYKKILMENDSQFNRIPYYIHLNPLDYFMPEWREGKVTDTEKAFKYLNSYRWSSHLDYLGMKNFPSLTDRNELGNFLGSIQNYKKEMGLIMQNPFFTKESNSIE